MNTITNTDIECGDCDYTISQGHFDSGKGRIMFNDINEEGTEYRCGCCDDRVSDPMGMFPDTDDEEEEPYCFKDTTIDTVNTDICFCSVGGCVKPTEFPDTDDEEEEEQIISHYDKKCEDCETIIENFYLNNPFGNGDRHCGECSERKMTKADWIKYHSEELLEGLVQSGKVNPI